MAEVCASFVRYAAISVVRSLAHYIFNIFIHITLIISQQVSASFVISVVRSRGIIKYTTAILFYHFFAGSECMEIYINDQRLKQINNSGSKKLS